jgi:hypothetical protein
MALHDYFWGGVPFGPAVQDSVSMPDPGELLQGERHVPYSTFNVIDLGGTTTPRYRAAILLLPQYAGRFMASLGQTSALVIDGTTYETAVLLGLTGHTMTPRREFHMFQAEWALLSDGDPGPV